MKRFKLKKYEYLQKIQNKKKFDRVSKKVDTSSIFWIITRSILKIFSLVFFGSLILFPFYYMIVTSLISEEAFRDPSSTTLATSTPHWGNYVDAFAQGYWSAIFYSFLTTSISIVLKLIVTMALGYAFSIKRWYGKKIMWYFFLSLMFLPEVALLSGQYKMMVNLGWHYGTSVILGLFIPFVASVFSAILFRNAFEAIPDMTKKAAMIDGVVGYRYFFKVALPMITPTIWTVSILTAFAAWNSYMWPALLLQGKDIQTIPTWVFTTGHSNIADENRIIMTIRMAGTVLAIIPMFIVFLFMRTKIMKSISKQESAIKG